MRILARFALGTALVAASTLGGLGACGEDTARVAERNDGGAIDGGDAGLTVLSCGVVVPNTYDSPGFSTNAKEELDLATAFESLNSRMSAAEGSGTSVVTANELRTIYAQGTPSLKSVSTSAAQAIVDDYFASYGDAVGKTWTPEQAAGTVDAGDAGDAGAPSTSGGKYGNLVFSSVGVHLREASAKTLLGGALYNHALVLASGPVTEATIDRLLATFGASTKFLESMDPDAGADADHLLAEYAAKRDDKSQATGAYRQMKKALLSAKTAANAGTKCSADLDASIKVFFAEWEKTTYSTAIFYLNDAASKAIQLKGDEALHSFGEALGLIQSFRGITQDRRKITDAQIDDLLAKIGATTPYVLVTSPSDRVSKLVDAINSIAVVYGWSSTDVENFEKNF